jgi:chromosome partitioning protein
MPHVIVVANQKGGVGKTTTAVNVAAGLARRGFRVGLMDLDLQGSATASLLGAHHRSERTVADAFFGTSTLQDAVTETATPGLVLLPAGEALATVDLHLAAVLGRERVLQRLLEESASALGSLNYLIVDTAPYLGLVTINALVSAHDIVVPVSCEYLPILGLRLFEETLGLLRSRLGARCSVLGHLLTLYDRRERVTLEVESLLRRTFGEAVFPTPIRVDTRLKSSPSHRKTIFDVESAAGRGRQDYERTVDELLARLDRSVHAPL